MVCTYHYEILRNFKSLKILMIRTADMCHDENELSFIEKNLSKIIEYFDMNERHKTYQVIYLREYTLFSRKFSEV